MNKVMKYQLHYASDDVMPYRDFMKELYELQNEMFRICNRAIQLYWENSGYQSEYLKAFGNYPKKEENEKAFGYPNIRGYIYSVVSKEFLKNNSGNISSALQKVDKKYKSESKEYYTGQRSIASYKGNAPIELHKNNIKVSQVNPDNFKEYEIVISLLSRKEKERIESQSTSFRFRVTDPNASKNSILRNIVVGTYSSTSSCITIKNGKIFLHLGYAFENKERVDFVQGRIMGIDLGIAYPVYMSFNDNPNREKILPGEIEQYRKKVESEKRSIQSQTKYCGEGKIGHGVKCRTKGIAKFQEKESNFRDTVNHRYSRFIVDYALKNRCGTIQMEDLSGISKENIFLKNWTYFDLQRKIEYKAKEVGIQVIKIKPQFTSQRCSKCGHIDKENRPTQSVFECKKCGFKTNADYNASQNIATDGIEKIIQSTINGKSANSKET